MPPWNEWYSGYEILSLNSRPARESGQAFVFRMYFRSTLMRL